MKTIKPNILALPTDVPGLLAYDPFTTQRDLRTQYIPPGFAISPAVVSHIYNNLLRNGGHWGSCQVTALYYDGDSYYVLDKDRPIRFQEVREHLINAVRINGHDGTVFNNESKAWEVRGYVHEDGDTLRTKLPLGMSLEQTVRSVGHYFEGTYSDYEAGKHYALNDDGSRYYLGGVGKPTISPDQSGPGNESTQVKSVATIHYWAEDGEVILGFTNGLLTSIATQVPNNRK